MNILQSARLSLNKSSHFIRFSNHLFFTILTVILLTNSLYANEDPIGVLSTVHDLPCNNVVNVALDANCNVMITVDMLLEGNIETDNTLQFYINPFGVEQNQLGPLEFGTLLSLPTGIHEYIVSDPIDDNECWGELVVINNNLPVLDCSCPVGGSLVDLPFVGTLDENSQLWTRPFVGGGACAPSAVGVDIPYSTHTFEISADAGVTSELTTFTAPSGDSFMALYADNFNPSAPCADLVITNDDGGVGLLSSFTVELMSGVSYTLVVTTFNNNGNDFGDYVVEMISDADFLTIDETCKFRCVDIDFVLNSTESTPNPIADGCTTSEVNYIDQLSSDEDGRQTILRTWVASNEAGSTTCIQEFRFDALTISDLTPPTSPLNLSCNAGTSPQEIVVTTDIAATQDNPATTFIENNEGFADAYFTYLIDIHPQAVEDNVCGIYITYSDQELDVCMSGCNGNRKVLRSWTLLDWNTMENQTFVQTINAMDMQAPTLQAQDLTVSTDPWGCAATFEVPIPQYLHDNCDYAPTYTVSGPAGVVITGLSTDVVTAIDVPVGVHTFSYVASDCCGNTASFPFEVTVLDQSPPSPVVPSVTVVNLSGNGDGSGFGIVSASSIDNGSTDGCTEVKVEIRRDDDACDISGNATFNADGHTSDGSNNANLPSYDPDNGEYVKFCCQDVDNAVYDIDGDGINDPGYVKVWLRVWDDGDNDGIIGTPGPDGQDNFIDVWSFVKVEANLGSYIHAPSDIELSCDEDYSDLESVGKAEAHGACGDLAVEFADFHNNLNDCGVGTITRRWSVTGRPELFDDQVISLTEGGGPVVVSFEGIVDLENIDCLEDFIPGIPTWSASPCHDLDYTVDTDTFRYQDEICYRMVHHYSVIDWCLYDPSVDPDVGIWRHAQEVTYNDWTQPTIIGCDDVLISVDESDTDGDGNLCETILILSNTAFDEQDQGCLTKDLSWTIKVDLWADGSYEYEWSSFFDPATTFADDQNSNGILDQYIQPTLSGDEITIVLPEEIEGGLSNHKVDWQVVDQCNNIRTCSYQLLIKDQIAPSLNCVADHTVSLEIVDFVPQKEIHASDFALESFDNCTSSEDLLYSFSGEEYLPTRRLTCGDFILSPIDLKVYVWDARGNTDFCTVSLSLLDPLGLCLPMALHEVSGKVKSAYGEELGEVDVKIDAIFAEYPRVVATNDEGAFAFANNPAFIDYSVTASKDDSYLNGVSTLDLALIQMHIVGIKSLDSPYQLIAADINADYDIKANDLLHLRRLILGVTSSIPTNESWRFVDASQDFGTDLDLRDVRYKVDVANLPEDMTSSDLVGVKIGDVTGNAMANFQSQAASARTDMSLELIINDKEVKAGEIVEVPFTSSNFSEVIGYQFTLQLNDLEFLEVKEGAVPMNESNIGEIANDVITVSYSSPSPNSADTDEGIFTVIFTASKDGLLSDMISISSEVTIAEAYVGEGLEVWEVTMTSRTDNPITETSKLYHNEPNPFGSATLIGFDLVEAGPATLTVLDLTGKLIYKTMVDAVRGYNAVTLSSDDLGVSGVLYYTITSGGFTETKKMVVVR